MPHRKSAHGYNMCIRIFAYSNCRNSLTNRSEFAACSAQDGRRVDWHRKCLKAAGAAPRLPQLLPRLITGHAFCVLSTSVNRETPMTKSKLEYIWLDGYTPVPSLRGKTQLKDFDSFPTLEQLPLWGFDGSSTMQAEGHNSDCVLKPVAV